jgi:hypothetical protein
VIFNANGKEKGERPLPRRRHPRRLQALCRQAHAAGRGGHVHLLLRVLPCRRPPAREQRESVQRGRSSHTAQRELREKGTRAGDNALFTLKLYSDARLTHAVGTAAYSCTVNFGQQAICEGQFDLTRGTMIAMGPADLRSGELVLPVTGGTGRYAGAHGQLTSTSASSKTNTQIVRFQLA